MLTAAITAAIAGILSLFGMTPTAAQLVVVAIVVKVIIVGLGVLFGAKLALRRRNAAAAAAQAKAPSESAPE
jgi:hypothetical protein